MNILIKLASLVLLPVMLSACSSSPEYRPAAIPPVIIKVPAYVALPKDATRPCDEPVYAETDIKTDVDLISAANRWKITAKCNAGKLEAIGKAQP